MVLYDDGSYFLGCRNYGGKLVKHIHAILAPIYLGGLLIFIGIGIASASWIFLLVAMIFLTLQINILIIGEERMYCEKYGDFYREYIKRTSRLIGISKSKVTS